MQFSQLPAALITTLEILSAVFIFAVGVIVLVLAVMYVRDVTQTEHTIRRNYPVIGRFRYLFEKLGEFFRQYFFARDREELPFNRAQRNWVYRAGPGRLLDEYRRGWGNAVSSFTKRAQAR